MSINLTKGIDKESFKTLKKKKTVDDGKTFHDKKLAEIICVGQIEEREARGYTFFTSSIIDM